MRYLTAAAGVLAGLIVLAAAGGYTALVWCACRLPAAADVVLPPAAGDDTGREWRDRTVRDLTALRRLIWDDTPIPYDAENPGYRRWALEGYDAAVARAEKVEDYAGYFFTLSAYAHGFGDPHISVAQTEDKLPSRWPGFVASRRGEEAEVVYRAPDDPSAPEVGARIVACDGTALPRLLDERVHPFRFNPAFARDRRLAMTRLFLDRGNPFAPPPASCRVVENGVAREHVLRWRDAPPDGDPWWTTFQAAGTGPAAPWGVTEPAPGVFWIGVPTFASGPQTAPKLDAVIADVRARGEALRAAKAVVVDLRGNGGGNSAYADRLAEAIFTGDVLARHRAPARRTAVDWRGSPGNAAFWTDWSERMAEEFGPFSLNRAGAVFLGWQLERVARLDPPVWREGDCDTDPSGGLTAQRPQGASPFPARVFVLTNGSCASSCLDFADRVLMVPGVKLVGSATSGDGPYMEVRDPALPSGLVTAAIPQKVYRGMGRGALEAYAPDIAYDGPWDDAAVRAWVLGLAEQDAEPR